MNWLGLLVAVVVVACDPSLFDPSRALDVGTTPQPSAATKPLATAASDPSGAASRPPQPVTDPSATPSASAVVRQPRPLVAGEVLPSERVSAQDVSGLALIAQWEWLPLPIMADPPEADSKGTVASQKQWNIQLAAAGRMRIDFASHGFPLALGSTWLASHGRYGSILRWPDGVRYRILPAGSLRQVLGEGRADLSPLVTATSVDEGRGRSLDLATRKTRLQTVYGDLLLEQAEVAEAAQGAVLLCRTLVEIAGIDPSHRVCQPHAVVVRAEYRWGKPDALVVGTRFQVEQLERRTDMRRSRFVLRPASAVRVLFGLPPALPGGGLKGGGGRGQRRTFLGELVDLHEEKDTPGLFQQGRPASTDNNPGALP